VTVLLVGLALGCGLLLIGSGLVGSRPSLATVLARLDHVQLQHAPSDPPQTLLGRLVGTRIAETRTGERLAARTAVDLRLIGQPPEDLLASVLTCGVVGLMWLPITAGLLDVGGVRLDPTIWLLVTVTLGVAGACAPLLSVRGRAARRRRAFRHALSCFLDLVAIRLAGGAGVDGALAESARAGHGWAFEELRNALSGARLAGAPPWQGFERLGTDLAIPELSELAASMALAGDEGARVRASLASKARAMRTRALTDTERNAQAASERMSLPIVVLMAGFVVFLGYPAVMRVIQGI
jgi:Flp pilus assembly protein TadB